jgi:hypothetical protein
LAKDLSLLLLAALRIRLTENYNIGAAMICSIAEIVVGEASFDHLVGAKASLMRQSVNRAERI